MLLTIQSSLSGICNHTVSSCVRHWCHLWLLIHLLSICFLPQCLLGLTAKLIDNAENHKSCKTFQRKYLCGIFLSWLWYIKWMQKPTLVFTIHGLVNNDFKTWMPCCIHSPWCILHRIISFKLFSTEHIKSVYIKTNVHTLIYRIEYSQF